MQTAHFHRAYWCYENNLGIAKIHCEPLGIFAILFEGGIPKVNVNFLDKNEFSYYWQKYKKAGITLHLGMRVGIDTELTRVLEKNNIFTFREINLEVKSGENTRYFRSIHGDNSTSLVYSSEVTDGWQEFIDDVFVEYQPCTSLIDVR